MTPCEADVLRNNLRFLNDPDIDDEGEEDEHPQVFLLNGWGEPGTALGEGDPGQHRRRQWTCWVAAHRLRSVGTGKAATSASGMLKPGRKLVVLEFELENDTLNPLYPLPGSSDISSSDYSSSFRSTSVTPDASGSGSNIAGQGAVSTVTTNAQTSRYTSPAWGSGQQASAKESDPSLAATITEGDEYVPSVEAIVKSTTNCSKPLKTLERMRRFDRTSTTNGRTMGNSNGAIGTRSGPGPIGTMDIFTILQEVNEQLGRAQDLLQLLDVVVGLVKDLTQFHRVLCYQFDDAWNGQVVAELVDWSQTQELYMGLHFPAADIPAQVCGGSPFSNRAC